MYEFTVIFLTGLGLVASLVFALTWVPASIMARRNNDPNATLIRLTDYAALPMGIGALYTLSMFNLLTTGVAPAANGWQMLNRIMTVVIFDLIVGLRAIRWLKTWATDHNKTWSPNHGASVVPTIVNGAFSGQDNALEGTSDHSHSDPR